MRGWPRAALAVAVIAGAMGFAGAPAANAATSERIIVVFKDGVDAEKKTDAFRRSNLAVPQFQYRAALKGFSATVTLVAKARIAADPDVSFVSVDREVHATAPATPIVKGDSAPTGVRRMGAATVSYTHLTLPTNREV